MNINQKSLELAAFIMAATRETTGEWFLSPSSGAVAERDPNADPKDVEYYGGNPICESVMPSTALGIVACQPNNVRVVCSELLRIKKELQHQQLVNKDHSEAFSRLRDAAADTCDRLKRIDDIPF
jgi:hypothetical protein